MYEAFGKRKAAERVEATRLALVQGLWANSNYDQAEEGKEAPRASAIAQVEEDARQALIEIYEPERVLESQIDPEHPFWAAMKVPELPKEMAPADERSLKEKYDIDVDQI